MKKAFETNLLESTDPAFPVSLRTADGMAEFPRIWAIGCLQIIDRPLLGFFCSQRCPGDIILHTYDLIRMLRDAGNSGDSLLISGEFAECNTYFTVWGISRG